MFNLPSINSLQYPHLRASREETLGFDDGVDDALLEGSPEDSSDDGDKIFEDAEAARGERGAVGASRSTSSSVVGHFLCAPRDGMPSPAAQPQ